ncbi:hypothetical protein EVAR_30074_1 [Eumeta japonica]|uniref:Reverse transcriptase domain-containing protein n=1 Tax=Eumeta variegata TaxID=151549 RepID=A0A4C1XCD2_EUMVA|nr:hypothetical protein EVAR_30074_1 [Eumeta japonica]
MILINSKAVGVISGGDASSYQPVLPFRIEEQQFEELVKVESAQAALVRACYRRHRQGHYLLDGDDKWKLRHYGVTGRALDLLKSYLSNRVQRVDVNVYINDLPSLVKDAHEIVLFADDTSLLFKVKRQQPTYDDVNNAISKYAAKLEFVNSTVFLGITLDDRLQWGPHIIFHIAALKMPSFMPVEPTETSQFQTNATVAGQQLSNSCPAGRN